MNTPFAVHKDVRLAQTSSVSATAIFSPDDDSNHRGENRLNIKRAALCCLLACLTAPAFAASYYVSSSGGSDSNNGTSTGTPWLTLSHVNAQSFSAGDTVYFKRGDTWSGDQLIPPSPGSSGNPISFDAYGTGAAPVFTEAIPISFVSGSWTYISGNVWKATMSATVSSPTVNEVQFGSVWGRKQPAGGGCASAIASKYDWCLTWPYLYVYSPSGTNPVTTYAADGSVTPIVAQAAGLKVISVSGKTWLTFQHIRVKNFDYMGVSVSGASDNLVFANMRSEGIVPYGTTPHGFYVNATNPTNIQFLNDDAHLNYDGFRFDGTATAITVTNCRGYANRDAGLNDNTGAATYSYSHFYGNNVAQLTAGDVLGGIAGSGNVQSTIPPSVTNFNVYPARLSFTVDDIGSSANTEAYVNTIMSVFSGRSLHFNAAIVPSYTVDWTSVNSWFSAGHEIDSHSWSHQYYSSNTNPQNSTPYANAPLIDIKYTGTGSAATLTISGNALSTTVTGASDSIGSIDLTASPNNTVAGLEATLAAKAHYTVSFDTSGMAVTLDGIGGFVRPNDKSVNLHDVSTQDIKTSTYAMLVDQTRLEPSEMSLSITALQNNVPGLTETFYVYPAGIEDPTIEAYAVTAGYTAARGSLSMKDQTNQTQGANSLYSNGVNVQNITSLGAVTLHGMTQPQIDQAVANLIFRASVWGAPYGLFSHYNSRGDNTPDINNVELGNMLDSVTAHGGTMMTNGSLATAITSGTNFSGTTRWIQNPSGSAADLSTATAGSPTVGAGTPTAYTVDINGVDRSALGTWDIGATAYVSQRYGTGTGSGQSVVK